MVHAVCDFVDITQRAIFHLFITSPPRYQVLPTNQTTPEPELTHLHRLTHSPRLDNTICGISLPPSPLSDIGRGSHPDDPDGCNCRLQSIICCLPPRALRATEYLLPHRRLAVGMHPCSLANFAECLVKQASYAVATQLGSGSPSSMDRGPWIIDRGPWLPSIQH